MAPQQLFGLFGGLCVLSMSIAGFFWAQGAKLVMPFAWLEMVAVGVALLIYARHAADEELIALSRGSLMVRHTSGNSIETVEFVPEWVIVEPVTGGKSLIELSGQGQRIEVGRFVRPELRQQFALQGAGVEVSSQLLSMLPYIATIVVLALISRNPAFIRLNMPASLGKPFHP
mgnify:CR=1 FL=1